MNRDVVAVGSETSRQRNSRPSRQRNIKHLLTRVAIKMTMLAHVRTKARRAALQGHLPHQPALHQRVQAVIDRGHGNDGHGPLGPHENFLRRRVIAFPEQHLVHLLPLRRESKAARGQSLIQLVFHVFICNCTHCLYNSTASAGAVNTWNNSNSQKTAGLRHRPLSTRPAREVRFQVRQRGVCRFQFGTHAHRHADRLAGGAQHCRERLVIHLNRTRTHSLFQQARAVARSVSRAQGENCRFRFTVESAFFSRKFSMRGLASARCSTTSGWG